MKNRLDTEKMEKLYEFGGLFCYRVMFFDEVTKSTMTLRMTFNFDAATELMRDYCKRGFKSWMAQELIQFDGAYSKRSKEGRRK